MSTTETKNKKEKESRALDDWMGIGKTDEPEETGEERARGRLKKREEDIKKYNDYIKKLNKTTFIGFDVEKRKGGIPLEFTERDTVETLEICNNELVIFDLRKHNNLKKINKYIYKSETELKSSERKKITAESALLTAQLYLAKAKAEVNRKKKDYKDAEIVDKFLREIKKNVIEAVVDRENLERDYIEFDKNCSDIDKDCFVSDKHKNKLISEELRSKKFCSRCKKWKELTEFATDKNRADGRYPRCLICDKERKRNERY